MNLLTLGLILLGTLAATGQQSTIARLRKDLLANYDKLARPIVQQRNTTVIRIQVNVQRVADLDEEKAMFAIDGWLRTIWHDKHLQWDPNDYDGLDRLYFGDEELWHPDLSIYNSAESKVDPLKKTNFVVEKTGEILWEPAVTFRLLCALNYENYPRDVQRCKAIMGSWSEDGNSLDLQFPESSEPSEPLEDRDICDLSNLEDSNPFWKVEKCNVSRNSIVYACCEEPYISMTFTFHVRRKGTLTRDAEKILRTAAHVLVLSMFWLQVDVSVKIVPGLFAVVCYVANLAVLTVTLPSAAAMSVACSPLYPEIVITITALVAEIVIVNVAIIGNVRPHRLTFLSSNIFQRIFCLCGSTSGSIRYETVTTARAAILEDSLSLETESVPMKNDFVPLVTILDRICFLVFALAFLITGNYF